MEVDAMTADEFNAWLLVARKHDVEEFSVGEVAVKFAVKAGPPIKERKEKPEQLTALEMLGRPFGVPTDQDVVTGVPEVSLDGRTVTAAPPQTHVQWAEDEPAPKESKDG